ncbi:MAG: hypothetical protein ACTSRC_06060 [Candidatus Helarchaeota archaeon]
MSVERPDLDWKLRVLMASKTKEHLTRIIKNWNDYCKANDQGENMLKGYSKYKKEELIDFIIGSIADEEKKKILDTIQDAYLEELFDSAKDYFVGNVEREKLQTVKMLEAGINLEFKGWQWENETMIELSSKGALKDYSCSCRIGRMGGFCPHLFTGIIILIKEGKIDLEQFPFPIPVSARQLIQSLMVDIKTYEDIDAESADIVLGDDYFISVKGDLVTMKWKGEHKGKSTKNINDEKRPISVEKWVAKKVVDKILAPLKHHSMPREIHKDNFGVIPIILADEKLVKKLVTKFKQKNDENDTELPTNKEDLEQFLTQYL